MLLGMPTLIETPRASDAAALCSRLGLDFLELNMNMPQYQPGGTDTEQLRELAGEYGIFYTVHLDENLDVSDFNPYVAEAWLRTVKDTIAFAGEIKAPIINMHLSTGVYFTMPHKKVYLYDVYKEHYLRSMETFRRLCEAEVSGNIKICIENCDGFMDFQKEALDLLLSSPDFGLTYDVGHNHGCGGRDEAYIIEKKEQLCHMHLHDALGGKNHLTLGTGELELERYMNLAAGQGCRVVLETKTAEALTESVSWLRERGYMENR